MSIEETLTCKRRQITLGFKPVEERWGLSPGLVGLQNKQTGGIKGK